MNDNFILAITLAIILVSGSFGQFLIDSAFAQNLNGTNDNSKSLTDEKTEQEKTGKKQKELDEKKTEHQEKIEEKQKELEQKKIELELHREILEVKQMEKSKEYEEKFNEIKEKHQNSTNQHQDNSTNLHQDNETNQHQDNDTKTFSSKSGKLDEKSFKKSKEIREKLTLNLEKLDSRTRDILDKVNNGSYLGERITKSNYSETYELVFDSVHASKISDKSQTSSSITGKMSFGAYDKNNSSLKLELLECQIIVDQTSFNCGFGKARTVSSGQSGVKDSLVIIAFLEDDVLKEIHTTMKIFLNADIPINKIENSQVLIRGPQSQISHMWFLNGTATLSKIISFPEEIQTGSDFTNSTLDKISTGD